MTQHHKVEIVEFTNGSFWQRMKFPPGCRERYLDVNRDRHRWIDEHHINLSGLSDLRKSHEVRRVCPPFHMALFCVAGQAWFRDRRAKRILKPGDLFLGPAGSQYSYGTDTQWRMAWFLLAEHPHWNDTFGKTPRCRRGRWTRQIANTLEALLDEADLHAVDSDWLYDAHERLLVGYLNRELRIQRQIVYEDIMLRLNTLAQIIYDQPAEPWTVDETVSQHRSYGNGIENPDGTGKRRIAPFACYTGGNRATIWI